MGDLSAVHDRLRSRGLVNVMYKGASGEELSLILPAADQEPPEEHVVRIRLSAAGAVTLDGAAIEPDAIESSIADGLARDEHLVVAIDAKPNATYADFFRVFREVKRADASRIQVNVVL
jgi:biopolymer transport protein ExbD